MVDSPLTDAERRYLDDLRKLPSSIPSRILGWTIELVPSIGLFTFGLLSDRRLFLILGFVSLLYFAVWRMYAQLRGFRLIQGIYEKRLAQGSPDA